MRDNPYKDLPPLERRPDGSLYRMDVVHRGNPNPNRLSDLHGVSARGDGSPLSRLSVADQTAPKARHQKRGNPVRISPFLVPVVGLEPTRCCHRRILNPLRLPFHHTGVPIVSI